MRQGSRLCGVDTSSRGSPPRSWLRKGLIVNIDTGTDLREAGRSFRNHCCLALECIDFAPRQFASLIPLGLSKQYKTCLPVLISPQLVARGRGLPGKHRWLSAESHKQRNCLSWRTGSALESRSALDRVDTSKRSGAS